MRLIYFYWIFQLFLYATFAAVTQLNPVNLLLTKKQYVDLLIGNPGMKMTFLIDYMSDDIVFHVPLETFSQTVSPIVNNSFGSELFYIGDYRIRFKFRYGPKPVNGIDLLTTNKFEGTLGLGKRSEIWFYWSNITVSHISLRFGSYYPYYQYDYNNYVQPLDIEKPENITILSSLGNYSTKIYVNFSSLDTYIPKDLFHARIGDVYLLSNENCQEILGGLIEKLVECQPSSRLRLRHQTQILPNKFDYHPVLESRDGNLYFGRTFMESNTWFYKPLKNKIMVSHSAFNFDRPLSFRLSTVVLTGLMVFWLLIQFNFKEQQEWAFNIIILLEIFIQIFCLFLLIINIFGLEWIRIANSYVCGGSHFLIAYIWYVNISALLMNVLLIGKCLILPLHPNITNSPFAGNKRRIQKFRIPKVIFLFGQMGIILWFCLVENFFSAFDVFYLGVIASTLTIASTFLILYSFFYEKKWFLISVLQTLSYYWFLFEYNFVPITHHMDLQFNRFLLAFFGCLLILWTSIILFAYYDNLWIKEKIKQHKNPNI